jgi:hypothetical protein
MLCLDHIKPFRKQEQNYIMHWPSQFCYMAAKHGLLTLCHLMTYTQGGAETIRRFRHGAKVKLSHCFYPTLYMSSTANLQTLHFKYLFNKYPY